ncbi:MAG TPA: trypsin-like serine protease [Polyangiaceae bacterium]
MSESLDEDFSVFNEDELEHLAAVEAGEQPNAISYGMPDAAVHREVVWIPSLGCSGVTISERYILTAGGCVADRLHYPVRKRGSIGRIQVQYSSDGVEPVTVYDGEAAAAIDSRYFLQAGAPCQYSEFDFALIQLAADATNFVRSRWHSAPIEPKVVQHEVVGWGEHGTRAGHPTPSGRVRMLGLMNSHGWDANQGINLVGGSLTDPGDSGGGYFIKPGSSTRILVGVHACYVSDPFNQGADGPRVSTHAPWLFTEAAALGRGLRCSSSSLSGVPYYYGCSD